jgi:diaminohydroxyphosphoribosylaminopyrimidine deaminase/5-amino-6-(5-phosphoribosylamino)uracil reductase|tara:strand:+ start:6743 stop:7786 length:1044 start_codon:yes stop_codon:yes gene_type:complete
LVNNLEFLGFSKPMALAMVEALKVNPYPNPRVGATLVDKHGGVKAISNHSKKGQNHAELNIFKQVEVSDSDTLYVTLEPCFHSDTSPSCALEIIKSGIKNVVIGDLDFDKRTNGKSLTLLKDNNISVKMESNANNVINPYYHTMHTQDRNIHYLLKIGMSKNEFITDNTSDSKYITNKISLNIAHYLRASADCIVIGKNTLVNDNPKLNIRINELTDLDHRPLPIVLWGEKTELLEASMKKFPNFTFLSEMHSFDNNVNCSTKSLDNVEEYLLDMNFRNIFIEGGRTVIDSFLSNNKIDSIYEFKSSISIKNGMSIGETYKENIKNHFLTRSEYQLNDNFLTTYTKN